MKRARPALADIRAHVHLAHLASRTLPDLGDVLRILDAGEAMCHARQRAELALLVQHARSRILVYRRMYDWAVPMARRALSARRATAGPRGGLCQPDCYLEALVDALAATGRFAEAAAMLDEAIAEAPQNGRLRRARGRLRLVAGQFVAAMDDYDAALAQGGAPSWLIERAVARLHAGDAPAARDDAIAHHAFRPRDARAAAWLAVFGERAVVHQPVPRAQRSRHVVAFLRGDLGVKALIARASAMTYADPHLAEAWMFVGVAMEWRGDPSRSRQAYERSLTHAAHGSLAQLWIRGRMEKGGA